MEANEYRQADMQTQLPHTPKDLQIYSTLPPYPYTRGCFDGRYAAVPSHIATVVEVDHEKLPIHLGLLIFNECKRHHTRLLVCLIIQSSIFVMVKQTHFLFLFEHAHRRFALFLCSI